MKKKYKDLLDKGWKHHTQVKGTKRRFVKWINVGRVYDYQILDLKKNREWWVVIHRLGMNKEEHGPFTNYTAAIAYLEIIE